MVQHCDPPYRAIGFSYTYRIYVFQCIAGYRAIPPLLGVSQNYVERGGGVRVGLGGGITAQACPLRKRVLLGGIAAVLSQIAVGWPTKSGGPSWTALDLQEVLKFSRTSEALKFVTSSSCFWRGPSTALLTVLC